jgi:quercetin dioxygenase-like cupin family protein
MSEAFIVETAAAPVLNVVGEQITVLASGAQTGSYEVCRQAGAEGGGPPPHSHPWDEAFFVIRGAITFGVGGREAVGQPGTFVHVPGGATHWFRFGAGGGEMISLTSPAGAVAMFTAFDREIAPDKPDLARPERRPTRWGLSGRSDGAQVFESSANHLRPDDSIWSEFALAEIAARHGANLGPPAG